MLIGCLGSEGHPLAGFVGGVFLIHFLLVWVFVGFQVFVAFFCFFNKECLCEMKFLFAVIHVFAGCFWIYTWILVSVSNVSYNIR